MLIPFGGYSDNSSTSLWEMIGITLGILFVVAIVVGGGGAVLVAVVLIAHFMTQRDIIQWSIVVSCVAISIWVWRPVRFKGEKK